MNIKVDKSHLCHQRFLDKLTQEQREEWTKCESEIEANPITSGQRRKVGKTRFYEFDFLNIYKVNYLFGPANMAGAEYFLIFCGTDPSPEMQHFPSKK